MAPGPIIAESARKHGTSDDDMLHAYDNATKAYDMGDGLTVFIGHATRMIEVGVVEGDLAPVIVHAMKARAKFL